MKGLRSKLSMVGLVVLGMLGAVIPVLAEDPIPPTALQVSMTAAMGGIVDNVIGCITVVAPIGITIFGAMLAWKYGKKFFQTIAG